MIIIRLIKMTNLVDYTKVGNYSIYIYYKL